MGKDIRAVKDFFANTVKWNLVNKFRKELDSHLRISSETHKITRLFKAIDHNTPWIHVRQDMEKMCHVYHLLFDNLGFIPSRCLNCWKVVVRPRTIENLFQLYYMQKDLNLASKCGIEVRDYVIGLYGGYFYNDSEEQGQACKRTVRKAVDEWIDPECPVILKRYCTEFEIKLGPSTGYKQPADAKEWERLVFENIDLGSDDIENQPDMMCRDVMERWIRFAWKYDPDREAVMKYTDGKDIYSQPITY